MGEDNIMNVGWQETDDESLKENLQRERKMKREDKQARKKEPSTFIN